MDEYSAEPPLRHPRHRPRQVLDVMRALALRQRRARRGGAGVRVFCCSATRARGSASRSSPALLLLTVPVAGTDAVPRRGGRGAAVARAGPGLVRRPRAPVPGPSLTADPGRSPAQPVPPRRAPAGRGRRRARRRRSRPPRPPADGGDQPPPYPGSFAERSRRRARAAAGPSATPDARRPPPARAQPRLAAARSPSGHRDRRSGADLQPAASAAAAGRRLDRVRPSRGPTAQPPYAPAAATASGPGVPPARPARPAVAALSACGGALPIGGPRSGWCSGVMLVVGRQRSPRRRSSERRPQDSRAATLGHVDQVAAVGWVAAVIFCIWSLDRDGARGPRLPPQQRGPDRSLVSGGDGPRC